MLSVFLSHVSSSHHALPFSNLNSPVGALSAVDLDIDIAMDIHSSGYVLFYHYKYFAVYCLKVNLPEFIYRIVSFKYLNIYRIIHTYLHKK